MVSGLAVGFLLGLPEGSFEGLVDGDDVGFLLGLDVGYVEYEKRTVSNILTNVDCVGMGHTKSNQLELTEDEDGLALGELVGCLLGLLVGLEDGFFDGLLVPLAMQ